MTGEGKIKPHFGLRNYFSVLTCLAMLVMGWNSSALADCELAKLLASDGAANDVFGCSVSISGGVVIIGAFLNDDNGSGSGSAYIYRFNGLSWVEEAKLLAPDGLLTDNFGTSVSISGDTVVVGAPNDDDNGSNSGSAYIFRFNGSSWVQETKLLASDGTDSDNFGYSVSISGDTVVVTACCDDDNGNYSGSAYIFHFNGSSWVQEAKLLASDGAEQDFFGWSASISGDTAVIGAYGDNDNGSYSGSAYIFRFNGSNWVQEAKLLASDGAANDSFGWSVSISNDAVIIGARGDDDNGSNCGSAYVYRFNSSSWVEEKKLLASDGTAGDLFGYSVNISGDTVIVGATSSSNSGVAYIFRFDSSDWVEEAKLLASDGSAGDGLGNSVSVFGNTILAGARYNDESGSNSGSAYIFGLSQYPGDLDFDNDVDFYDFSLFAARWLETDCGACSCERTDLTGDGQVDYYDLKEMCDNWLAGT